MPPTHSKQPQLKQKTLTSFFSKNINVNAKTSGSTDGKSAGNEASSTSSGITKRNMAKPSAIISPTSAKKGTEFGKQKNAADSFDCAMDEGFTGHSSPSNMKNTPPTSDPIDVDMVSQISDEEDFAPKVYVSHDLLNQIYLTGRQTKRKKAVIEDSDEELAQTIVTARISSISSNKLDISTSLNGPMEYTSNSNVQIHLKDCVLHLL